MTTRIEARVKFGCQRVAEITNIRKALGQSEWQDSQICDRDVRELAEYFRLVREEMVPSSEAILGIASDREGGEHYEINPDAVNQHNDGSEEKGEMTVAIQGIMTEAALGLTDAGAAAAEQLADIFTYSLATNLASALQNRVGNIRSNFSAIGRIVASVPIDMKGANLPSEKKAQPKQIGMWKD